MNRRDALRALGGAVAISALPDDFLALGRELHARAARARMPQVLEPHQNETVATIAELIIPQTDTPGARAARVNEFIDLALAEWYDDADRDRFLAGLADVDGRARALCGKDFVACRQLEQVQILTALDAEVAAEAARVGTPTKHFFHMCRRLTLVGYYTSEVGANQELHYQIIPGRYDGCSPLDTGGR